MSVGETVSQLKQSAEAVSLEEEAARGSDQSEGWQVVEGSQAKRRKKIARNGSQKYPSISHSSSSRLQSMVKVSDLQNLVLYMLADGPGPQWCAVKNHGQVRKVVVLMVPGLEAGLFDGSIPMLVEEKLEHNHENGHAGADSSELEQKQQDNASETQDNISGSSFQPVKSRKQYISPDDYYPTRLKVEALPPPLQSLSAIFDHVWPIKAPGDDKYAKMHSPMGGMLISPIVKPKEDKNFKGPKPPAVSKNWKDQQTPITEFVASTWELVEENYVLHPAHYGNASSTQEEAVKREINHQAEADGWIDTSGIPELASEMEVEQIFTMDCEMCITSPAGVTPQVFSLTRISILDWDGNMILDEFVKPPEPITDYLTPYSGITAEKLAGVTTSLKDIQQKLLKELLTPNTILIGHSLSSDLNALKLTHPYIVDTALLFPHPRGPPLKSSLKWLAQKYLSREIQKGHGQTGHDSVEDARACLDLVKQKCEKGKAWGTSEASGESIFKRLASHRRPKRDKVHPDGDDEFRTGAVVDWGDPRKGYGASAKEAIGCQTDDKVVNGIKEVLSDDTDDRVSTERGVDFVFARFRELEAHRGWWNKSKTLDNQSLLDNVTASSQEATLADVATKTVQNIGQVWDALPPCTAFIVFSGSGDPRELAEMQALQQQFKQEFRVKKWDELSVRWTDEEEQKLRKACSKARRGIGLIKVK